MKKTVSLLILCVLLSAAIANAADIMIGAGSEVGEYTNTIVPAIDQALQEQGKYRAQAVTSAGSQENLDRLLAGKLDAALVQLDVLAMNESSFAQSELQMIGLIAPEALLCAAREGGKVRSYYNLTDQFADPLLVSAGAENSGTAHTLQFLMELDPELSADKVTLYYEGNIEAELDRAAAGSRDLVCFVMLPNPDNELLEKVSDNDDLQFIDFVNAMALEVESNGIRIYEPMVVPVSKGVLGIGADKVETLTTWVALVARADTDADVVAALSAVVADPELLPPNTAAGKAKRMYTDFKSKAKDLTGQAKEKAAVWTAKAKQKAGELTDKASDLADQAKEKASELSDKAKTKASELKDKAITIIKKPEEN